MKNFLIMTIVGLAGLTAFFLAIPWIGMFYSHYLDFVWRMMR
jgi:hypothetical protein